MSLGIKEILTAIEEVNPDNPVYISINCQCGGYFTKIHENLEKHCKCSKCGHIVYLQEASLLELEELDFFNDEGGEINGR